jgi:hypothetical protein
MIREPFMNNNHKYLRYTNMLLLISIAYFLCTIQDIKNHPKVEFILATFLLVTIVCSQLFWDHPIQHSTIHKIDAIVAKIVIFSFILYTLMYKFKFSFLIVLAAIFISFYFSHTYSSQEWCCTNHLCCHGLMHIFCFIATFYTFMPV